MASSKWMKMNFTQWLIFLFTQALLMYLYCHAACPIAYFHLQSGNRFLMTIFVPRRTHTHFGRKVYFPSWQISKWPPAKLTWRDADKYINRDDTKNGKKQASQNSKEVIKTHWVTQGAQEKAKYVRQQFPFWTNNLRLPLLYGYFPPSLCTARRGLWLNWKKAFVNTPGNITCSLSFA